MTSQPPAEELLAAVRCGDRARALSLVEQAPDPGAVGIADGAALGEVETVAAALDSDPGLATAPDAHGWTPLLYACASPLPAVDPARAEGVTRCVELLLDHGADPSSHTLFDHADPNSRLPALYHACVADQPRVVRLLLERGADGSDGESIYHAAELDRRECLELLLAQGVDPSSAQSHWGNTPLYFLACYRRDLSATTAAGAGMRWLLEHGADANVPSTPRGETPLHRVAEQHDPQTAELLLAHGAEVDRPRSDGRTPYALALRTGNQAVADLLLERGADPGRVGPLDTFLAASLRADETAARTLLAQHPGLLDELGDEERGALGWAVERELDASVRLMVELGFDLSWQGPHGGTPLHLAAWQGRAHLVELLLELGAPVDVRDTEFGSSPLGWAAHGSANCRTADDDYCEVVEALIAAAGSRAAATNRWEEPPESLASPRVAALIRRRTSSTD